MEKWNKICARSTIIRNKFDERWNYQFKWIIKIKNRNNLNT